MWPLIILSLLLHIVTFSLLFLAYRKLREVTGQVADQIGKYELKDVVVPFHIDESLPVDLTIDYEDEFRVPIKTTIPVSTSILFEETVKVPIRDTIKLDRDFEIGVNIPVINQTVPILLPLRASVPIKLDVEVPLSYEIPVKADIPIDMTITFPVKTSFPIKEEVPVKLDFPVTIPVEQTGLPQIIDALRDGLKFGEADT